MNDKAPVAGESSGPLAKLPRSLERLVDSTSADFVLALHSGSRPRIEDYLSRIPAEARPRLLLELIAEEVSQAHSTNRDVNPRDYESRFPDQKDVVELAISMATPTIKSTAVQPAVGRTGDVEANVRDGLARMPERIGRYEVRRLLGRGAFGCVYRAEDPVLKRMVAIKVPRMERFASGREVERFLGEARHAARLRHPGIVTVHDVIQEADRVCAVQEYVEGQDLRTWLKSQERPYDIRRIVQLMAEMAEAVGYAHQQGLIHRDLKPANVLLDAQGRPHIADFGLAVHENEQRDRLEECAGAPAYMSPEQVRGEAHRMDGRADIWALGVILYEMLTGRRPFLGGGQRDQAKKELFDEICERDPKPPRQIDPDLPEELQCICLQCLQKKPEDRYSTAFDLARDLRRWLAQKPVLLRRIVLASALAFAVAGVGAVVLLVGPSADVAPPVSDAGERRVGEASTVPRVMNLELHVRRHGVADIDERLLVANGVEEPSRRLAPFGPLDDWRLYAVLDRPACWYLLRVDPAGEYDVDMCSFEPQKNIQFPRDGMMAGFGRQDPSGVNALLLVTATSLATDFEDQLKERFGKRTDVVAGLPIDWAQLRAPLEFHECVGQLPREFLEGIESQLPPGHKATHALFLQTQ